LRRIFVRFQGAAMGAYQGYVTIAATQKTGKKTSKMDDYFFPSPLGPVKE